MTIRFETTDRIIKIFFGLLFFFIPLLVIPINSELFEFGKIVFLYLITILITGTWIVKCILTKKVIIKKSLLNLPLVIFLVSQIISTYVSIDPATSLFGYYSRFNGGLLSILAYTILYFAFISNVTKKDASKNLYFLVASSFLVSIYAILEHFGIDKNIWVQDVQNRVFSTLGQPNWLAAWLTIIIPISLFLGLTKNKWWLIISALNYLALLYTKSRSGIIAFVLTCLFFWLFEPKKNKKELLLISTFLLVITGFTGTPWTPKISDLNFGKKVEIPQAIPTVFVPALESGGTESGSIRKIVWKGALDVFYSYPIFGSGVETFAYSFYQQRPKEHNLVSEWDFLYNKAHNEYLNYLATTGGVGFTSYLLLILLSLYLLIKNRSILDIALLTGYLSILITNFFGFSVVPVSLLFFLLPAISLVINDNRGKENIKSEKLSPIQFALLSANLFITFILLFLVVRYWYADVAYNNGKALNNEKNFTLAGSELTKAIKYSPIQSTYYDELSQTLVGLSLEAFKNKDLDTAKEDAKQAIVATNKAIVVSPGNIHLLKSKASLYIKLAEMDPKLITFAIEALEEAGKKSPTDAKIFYNLSLLYEKTGDHQKALDLMLKTVELKLNYKEGRYALAIFYKRAGKMDLAKNELEYILRFIAPNDANTQKLLESIN